MSVTRKLARDWLPPALTRRFRTLRDGAVSFSGDYAKWAEAIDDSGGYADSAILERVLTATRAVQRGEAAYERDGQVFTGPAVAWPLLSGVMFAAARDEGRLRVLDIGGALGSSYFQHRAFLAPLHEISWHIVEQPGFVAAGREHIDDHAITFFESIEDSLAVRTPNVVVLSSSLQYFERPADVLSILAELQARVLIFDRTPFHAGDVDKLVVQHVPPSIYRASYPCWILSRERLLEALGQWSPVADDISPEGEGSTDRGLDFAFRAIVFSRPT